MFGVCLIARDRLSEWNVLATEHYHYILSHWQKTFQRKKKNAKNFHKLNENIIIIKYVGVYLRLIP